MKIWTGTRKDGICGHFLTKEEVPSEFTYPFEIEFPNPFPGLSVERQLEIMNQHWRNPVLGPMIPEIWK